MGHADPSKYPITDPTLAFAMEERYEKLIPQTIKKNWLLDLILNQSKRFSFAGANKQVGFYPDGPAVNGQWVSYNDPLPDWTDSDPVIGYANQCYAAVPLGWNILQQLESKGDPSVIIDRMNLRTSEASWALRRLFSTAFWSGTGGKQPTGLSSLLQKAAMGSQTGSHLAVSRTTPWHQNQYVILTTPFGTISTGSSVHNGILALQDLIDACTVGNQSPYCLISGKAEVKMVRRAAMETGNYMLSMTKREDVEFGNLTVMVDGVPMGWDAECPADSVYALHIGKSTKDPKRVNNVDPSVDGSDWGELDEVDSASSFFEMDGNLSFIDHPAIRGYKIEPRSGLSSLGVSSWMLHSANFMIPRLSQFGVLGSSGGSYLSTWS